MEFCFSYFYRLNNGLIIPTPARPDRSANVPRPKTTTPADLKKSGAYLEREKDNEPKESNPSTGSVPSANESIIIKPEVNDPLESADICID